MVQSTGRRQGATYPLLIAWVAARLLVVVLQV